jgi:hypothetical protein
MAVAVELLIVPLSATIESIAPAVNCEAGTTTVACVLLTNVVGSETPPTRISVELVNPLPLTVRVVAALPAAIDDGETALTVNAVVDVVEEEGAFKEPPHPITHNSREVQKIVPTARMQVFMAQPVYVGNDINTMKSCCNSL